MNDKVFNRDFLFLVLLLVFIAGFFLWKNPELVSNLFSSPGLNLTENTGLDLGDINFKKTEEIEEVEKEPAFVPLSGTSAGKEEVVILAKINVLEPKIGQIYKEVNRIAQEVAEIEKQVKNLIALAKVQKLG